MKVLWWAWRHLEELLGGLCFAVVVGAVATNVLMRYVFQDSIAAASEVATALFVWSVMFGIGAAARERLHPSIDLLNRLLPVRAGTAVQVTVDLAVIYLLGDLILSSWSFAWGEGFTKFTGALELPYVYVYLSLPIGFGLMLIRVLANFVTDIRLLLNKRQEVQHIEYEKSPEERTL